MKNLNLITVVLFFMVFAIAQQTYAQEGLTAKPAFDVHRVHPYISINKENLGKAKTLSDLNPHFKPSWVRTYISVEVMTKNNGKQRKVKGKNELLTQEQKANMNTADAGTEILVHLKYLPENTLTFNDMKEINFSFTIDPEIPATYIGGHQQLLKYLNINAIDKIHEETFTGYDLAAVKFTVNEDGIITKTHIFESSGNIEIDQLLLETVRTMPCWEPATYANGTKTKQEFVLTVGNMDNCIVPLLNIHQD